MGVLGGCGVGPVGRDLTMILTLMRIVFMSSPVRPLRRAGAILASTAVLAVTVSGCAAFSDDQAGSGTGVRITASFYPLEFVSQRVAGDLATVTDLTSPGQEPHDLELSVRGSAALADADLVVYERGFQPAVDTGVDENATGETLDAASVVKLQPLDHDGHDHDHGDHGDHDEGEHEGEEGHEEHGIDGDLDPHFWQDPLLVADLGDALAEKLAAIDPDHAETYETNAAELRSELETLDTDYTDGLAQCARTTVVVSHDAFGYLAKYGLDMASIAGLSPDAEPTPADLRDLQDLVATEGITTVFSETLVSPKLAETLASDAGVKTAVLDPVEGLADGSGDADYLTVMRANLDALRTANDCA